jgi:hypothetical protein
LKTLILLILLIPQIVNSQVGIDTTNPQETIDVNATLRASSIPTVSATKMMGTDGNGTMNEIVIGDNLQMNSGTLNPTGTTNYFVKTMLMPTTSSGHQFHNVNLDLTGANKDITVFRIAGSLHNFEFTGIAGGTDGKHIVLVNVTSNNFKLSDNASGSLPQNRISTLVGGFEQTSGQGVTELVYDGATQKWIILNFRN